MEYQSMSVKELRTLCRERLLGTGVWRAGASKEALVGALESGVVSAGSSAGPDLGAVIASAIADYLPASALDEKRVVELIRENGAGARAVSVQDLKGVVRRIERVHPAFDPVLVMASQRIPVLMVGPAGSGKTTLAENIASSLGLAFSALSVGAQTTQSQFFGYMSATGNYVPSEFFKRYTEGGVFLCDEIDAGNANVLVGVRARSSRHVAPYYVFNAGVRTGSNPQKFRFR